MKQATALSLKEREQYFLDLAPTDIEAVPVIIPSKNYPTSVPIHGQTPAPAKPKPEPQIDTSSKAFKDLVQQEAARQICEQNARNLQRQATPLPSLVLKAATVGAGGVLAFEVLSNFNPLAAVITGGVMIIVGALTKPSSQGAAEEKPTYMPKSMSVKQSSVTVNPTINPVINCNVAVNVQQ